MATRAKTVYANDISYGSTPFRRGHWADRLPSIDQDVAALKERLSVISTVVPLNAPLSQLAKQALQPNPRPAIAAHHTPAASFHPGSDLALTIATPDRKS